MTEPLRIVDRPFPYDEVELVSIRLGRSAERFGIFASRTRSRARSFGGKRSGRTIWAGAKFRPDPEHEPERWAPSKHGRVVPSYDCTALPMLSVLFLRAAREAHQHGLLRTEDWTRAGLEPPNDVE